MRFFIITGRRHIGKTTFLLEIIEDLKDSFSIGGVLTLGDEKKAFVNLQNRAKCDYYIENSPIKERIGDYVISEKAIKFAEQAIKTAVNSKLIIIDEFGRLERDKKGLYNATNQLIESIRDKKGKILIMIVQIDVVDKAKNLLNIHPEKTWVLKKKSNKKLIQDSVKKELKR
ncbi:MAG: hypothetical protein KAU62_06905 [Candidatus Heimdallarchaeota archaeon]|nr:hypothetical protein [Candidatus Heimdallarchaeota archaeon]MCG3255796.1 hypothetical protein [Candidatus Heimdallarchaeota archaeon]MCK4610869.1 hypothetical protein [Candidatus Heimdallarchaeota archaeon]